MVRPLHLRATQVQQYLKELGIASRFTRTETARFDADVVHVPEGFVTFPIPKDNAALTILNLRRALGTDPEARRQPIFFDHPWYLDEPFAQLRCGPGWHAVALTVLPESIGQPFYYIDSIRSAALSLPHAVEVVLMLFLYFAHTGRRLLNKKHTWTCDPTEDRRFVTTGAFGPKGLFLSAHPVGYRSRGLGICPTLDVQAGTRP